MTHRQELRQALLNQYNVIVFFGTLLFVPALWSPLPALLAAGGELLWLAVAPASPAARRWNAALARRRREQRWNAEAAGLTAGLDETAATRLRTVVAALVAVSEASEARADGGAVGRGGANLKGLLRGYALLAGVHMRVARTLAEQPAAVLEEEIVRVGQAVTEERDAIARLSLRQTLAHLQRRLAQTEQVEAAGRALGLKMAALEQGLGVLHAQMANGRPDDELAALVEELKATARFDPAVEGEAAALVRARITSITQSVNLASVRLAAGR